MDFIRQALDGVILVTPDVFVDSRGFFMESWHEAKFTAGGIDARFVQDNHSKSGQGTLRGLHYQLRNPQGKLVRVVAGEIFDVVVDIRRSSPTFGQWIGVTLSDANRQLLWIPPGFAHGFYVLSESAEFLYKCTDFYAPEDERSILWSDPELGIRWPLIEGVPLNLSNRDANAMKFREAETYP